MNRAVPILIGLLTLSMQSDTTPPVDPIDAWMEKALDAAGGTTVEMRNVYAEAYERWDAELNAVYRRLMDRLSEKDKPVLRDAQRKWLQWRESEHKLLETVLYGQGPSGTLALIVGDAESLSILKDRVMALRSYEGLLESPP